MSIEDVPMSDDHLLMQDLMESYGVTVKRLAAETGLAGATIYKYLGGQATIPMVIWRKLYEITGDARIYQLITGQRRVLVVAACEGKMLDSREFVRMLVKERKIQLEFESEILDALADGQINRTDAAHVLRIHRWFPESVEAMGKLYQAVVWQYEHCGSEKKR